ncbi:DNA cytosine methyltransferase [Gordonia cholesterolivorans]|uniref:DNA (cytosine-5-)-methyltransferase n=1 Tax=Gordonia cholesterolivorans TaxID=559625 RepID=A0ABP5UBJ7_9ACTN
MGNVTPIGAPRPRVLEFFAGIGLAKMGLEQAGFSVAWANDYEEDKKAMYVAEHGDNHPFALGDVANVTVDQLPRDAALAWASSPCTDLSLAGNRAGFAGAQSGTFWQFIRLMDDLKDDRPEVVVLENVVGLATSHGGDDLTAAIRAFNKLGYSVDVLALDARRWLPQSRPRLFLVGAQNPPEDCPDPNSELRPDWLQSFFGDPTLDTHRAALPAPPIPKTDGLDEVVEPMKPGDARWWDAERTKKFVSSLSKVQAERIAELKRGDSATYRTAYRRTRNGVAVWEVRADAVSGCLRTARGGSSKQAVVKLGGPGKKLQVRWMTPKEYAALMGAPDYDLSGARTNQALFGFGDAVAVPAVKWLGENYLLPLLRGELGVRTSTVEDALGEAVSNG